MYGVSKSCRCRWSFMGSVKPTNLPVLLDFTEYLDYDYQNNSCDEEKMCGHYTQVGHTNTVCARALLSWLSFNCVCVCVRCRWCGPTHTEWAVPFICATKWRAWTGRRSPSWSATITQRQ